MRVVVFDEKTETEYSSTIDSITVNDFYSIDDDLLDSHFEKMESKYNVTIDFTGGEDFIIFTIYEAKDQTLFEKILEEWSDFIKLNVSIE